MRKDPPNRIAELRKRKNMTQAALAEKVGAHWVTISKLERGHIQLSMEWMERLAAALDVEAHEFFPKVPQEISIFLAGLIGERGNVTLTPAPDEDPDHDFFEQAFSVTVGADDENTTWLSLENDAMWPYFNRGDLLRFTYYPDLKIDEYVGAICLISLDHPEQKRPLVGMLLSGSEPERYDIHISGAGPLRNVKVIWAARLTMAIFGLHGDIREQVPRLAEAEGE